MIVGIKMIFVIAIMGGIVAFLGDKIGTRVGKRRMSIFGLRPRHTSIIVTIVTGICIAAATLTVLAITSNSVRVALFGMTQLQEKLSSLDKAVVEKNKELSISKLDLDTKTKALQHLKKESEETQADLERVTAAKEEMGQQLLTAKQAYDRAEKKLLQSHKEVANLEETKRFMESRIEELQVTKTTLEQDVKQLRQGDVVFKNGETLSAAIIKPGLSEGEAQLVLANILEDTNRLVLRSLHMDNDAMVLTVSEENVDRISKELAEAKTPMAVRITAVANIIYGEPALAEITLLPHNLVVEKGSVILEKEIQGGADAQYEVLGFLKEVNASLVKDGVIPEKLTGTVGVIANNALYPTIAVVQRRNGPVRIKAIANEDGYTDGPISIRLVIE